MKPELNQEVRFQGETWQIYGYVRQEGKTLQLSLKCGDKRATVKGKELAKVQYG